MTKYIFYCAFTVMAALLLPVSTATAQTIGTLPATTIEVTLKNNSIFPRKVILKQRDINNPDSYGSYIQVYLPYGTKKIQLPLGTTIERMAEKDLPIMMDGKGNERTGKIIVVARPDNQGKTFNLWD